MVRYFPAGMGGIVGNWREIKYRLANKPVARRALHFIDLLVFTGNLFAPDRENFNFASLLLAVVCFYGHEFDEPHVHAGMRFNCRGFAPARDYERKNDLCFRGRACDWDGEPDSPA